MEKEVEAARELQSRPFIASFVETLAVKVISPMGLWA